MGRATSSEVVKLGQEIETVIAEVLEESPDCPEP